MIFALKIMTSAFNWISTHPMSWDLINAIVAYIIYAFKKYKKLARTREDAKN